MQSAMSLPLQGVRFVDKTGAKSPYWKHFSYAVVNDIVDKTVAVCKLCKAKVKHSRNTTNLKHHLETWHMNAMNSDSSDKQPAVVTESVRPTTSQARPSSNNKSFDSGTRAERITNMMVVYLLKDLLPISTVESVYFKALMNECESRYTVPPPEYFLRTKIPGLYQESKMVLTAEISLVEKVCITVEQWQSRSSQSYITLSAHYITGRYEIQSKVLQTDLIAEDSSAQSIASMLKQVILEWQIPTSNGMGAVIDNTGNMKEVMTILNCQPVVSCLGHTINEAAKTGMRFAQDTLAKTRNLVRFFHRSALASSILQEIQMQFDLPMRELFLDVPSLWYTSYDMLDMTIKHHSAICASLQDPRVQVSHTENIADLTDELGKPKFKRPIY